MWTMENGDHTTQATGWMIFQAIRTPAAVFRLNIVLRKVIVIVL